MLCCEVEDLLLSPVGGCSLMLAASLLPSLPSMWRGESMWSRAVEVSLLGKASRGQGTSLGGWLSHKAAALLWQDAS